MTDIHFEPDARDLAFEALLPLSKPTADALDRVEQAVSDEHRVTEPLRKGLHITQLAALSGLGRFSYAIRELIVDWGPIPDLRRTSTSEQETQNIYLWSLAERYMLRVKHDPVDRVDPGTQRLFAELPAEERPVQVFLTWDIGRSGNIVRPVFACVEEPKWTISLAQLLAHGAAQVSPAQSERPGATVRSKHARGDEQRDQE